MNGSMRARKIGNASRWREWARSVARRRNTAGRSRSGLVNRRRNAIDLALARRARGTWTANHDHHVVVHPLFSPVSRAVSVRTAVQASFFMHTSTAERFEQRVLVRQGALQRIEHVGSTSAVARTIAREIVERTVRIEDTVPLRTHFAAPVMAQQQIPETPAALDRQMPARTEDQWWEPGSASPRQRSIAPTINIDHLADTVMRQIDHRIGAWRERMGRV